MSEFWFMFFGKGRFCASVSGSLFLRTLPAVRDVLGVYPLCGLAPCHPRDRAVEERNKLGGLNF
jgi:hypothetical protein